MLKNGTPCPVCHQPSYQVGDITVKNLLKQDSLVKFRQREYFLCSSPGCEVAYFTAEQDLIFNKEEIKVKIWFKEQSPVPVCYCKGVTDEVILKHIVDNRCCNSLPDIIRHTGAGTGKKCFLTNPTGG